MSSVSEAPKPWGLFTWSGPSWAVDALRWSGPPLDCSIVLSAGSTLAANQTVTSQGLSLGPGVWKLTVNAGITGPPCLLGLQIGSAKKILIDHPDSQTKVPDIGILVQLIQDLTLINLAAYSKVTGSVISFPVTLLIEKLD